MSIEFEWDEEKAEVNRRKHGIGFDEATTVFGDPRSLTIHDPDHSPAEDRYVDLGVSLRGRVLVVVYTDREERIRIISAREASGRERRQYEQR